MPEKIQENNSKLIIVSNRLPIILNKKNKQWNVIPGSGGLITAFNPILKNHYGSWIGWLGTYKENEDPSMQNTLQLVKEKIGYNLHPISLSKKEIDGYYHGFSNEILWPLFHSLETRCHFVPEYWESYLNVNRKFAKSIAENSKESDCIWIQDYHLISVGYFLRNMGLKRKVIFFMHIPFPPPDVFLKLPWRAEILQSLLEYDLVGVHTSNDLGNLIEAFRRTRLEGLKISNRGGGKTVTLGKRHVIIGAFPISIDFKEFTKTATSKKVLQEIKKFNEAFPNKQVILGIDRLDYTKGIPERLEAFCYALKKYPSLRGKISLVQVVLPSRTAVPEYELLKIEIERLISEINGKFSSPEWTPIRYFYRVLSREELVAYYQCSDIAFITPLKDGMNLISKEYCTCNLNENGVLILSEFAGSAAQLKHGAILVNPNDLEGVSKAIYQAFTMPTRERKRRMNKLRKSIQKNDIHNWSNRILSAVSSNSPESVVKVEEFTPEIQLESAIAMCN